MPTGSVRESYVGGGHLGPFERLAVMDALRDRYPGGDVDITPYRTGILRGGIRLRSTNPAVDLNNPVFIGIKEIGSSNTSPAKYVEQSAVATFGWRVASVVYNMFLVW